jgi:hypothetical protein
MASTSGEWWMKQELKVGCLAGTPIRGEGGNDGDWRGAKEGDEEDSVQISGGLKQPLVDPRHHQASHLEKEAVEGWAVEPEAPSDILMHVLVARKF